MNPLSSSLAGGQLSLRQLRAFLALAQARHFTRAAAACHLSQPAFSALIQQLEAEVGARLFDRTTRSVELTPEGQAFAAGAQRIVDEAEATLALMRERAQGARGRVALALLPSLAAGWLPPVLAAFQARWPGIEVQVADVLSEPCLDRVRQGLADFALAASPATRREDMPELVAEPFCADDFHLVCPVGHPLADPALPAAQLTPQGVAAWPFVHLARTSSVRPCIEAAIHPQALRPVLEVEQLATVAGLVKAGLGVSIVPALTLYQFQDAALATRPLAWPGLSRQIYRVRRRERSLSTAAQALYDWVLAHAPGASP
ncbi:LysR family transcriptional regulator [Ideonella sp. TBM-1]|uniref:LysR family transcriptional regulator n=2 Tax=Ideonella livida TaxID=2707176 RepID=A0A7C9TM05_9BURK|nr:LysR family transcriptional regulator [Ideonella livida]